ncbi:biotin/methionine sulfoxide reductase [Mameliella alba]|uniref:molybdopterin-dependent oxidoreductase n=1 Tax=Mameliella alba TaxID=561184 RepID=UPI000890EFBD|nr:molybdopterin-dependent oxidoreductase [Mameliella alba]OWV49401.1 Asp-tRNA(Asn)/Glu-tRNA(Gln) amidotransferase GatCAB subunit C [Mameliella alba]PTR41357.1 biotin/methionine sulfoxide reductase [Mameliella alba]GGF50828.1 dimethylsulfoxide reductase [Mameliella alba]SDC45132.1 biotin/methionine sulfoxide reductase [Mameliella alba]
MADKTAPSTKVTSSHWGAFEVDVEGDRIVATRPFSQDPHPSRIPDSLPAAVHHKTRVARPSIRRGWLEARERGGRGAQEFVELPWDEALDIAAAEIDRVRHQHGNESIFGGSYGWGSAGRFHHAQSQVHRFLNCIGGYVASFGSYSTGCAQSIMPHVLGVNFLQLLYEHQDGWQTIHDNTETLVMFGGINPKNSQVSMGGITEHETAGWFDRLATRGTRCINIGPQRTDAPEGCEWLPVRPGSDTALMLALAHVLEEEGLVDRAFLASHTVGYERFRPYLVGNTDGVPKTPDWAAPLCGVGADEIRALARRMASTRTLITVAWSLQRAEHGEQPYWMSVVLAAMLGQIGLPGGGVGYGYGAIGGVGKSLLGLRGMTFPQLSNPVEDTIPVARIGDMLRNPGRPYDFNGQRKTYPDIRLVYWAGGNPYHHHQDLNALHEAWQRPETIIVNEPWWTATAKRADIVFPATTPYEREDIGRTNMDDYLFHMPRLIPPVGQARDDYDIFSGLAERCGVGHQFTEGRSADDWIAKLYAEYRDAAANVGIDVPDLDGLRERNWIKLPIKAEGPNRTFFAPFREDPDAFRLGTPSGRIEIFSATIDSFRYDDCPGHPVWLPPTEWLGTASAAAPLHLVSPQPGDKLHSQLEAALADVEGARPETLVIHPDDAAAREITTGDLLRVFNARGACRARASVSSDINPGVVALPTGAWFGDPGGNIDPDGNPNVLTLDVGTSRLGQGCSAHSALVQVTRLS